MEGAGREGGMFLTVSHPPTHLQEHCQTKLSTSRCFMYYESFHAVRLLVPVLLLLLLLLLLW